MNITISSAPWTLTGLLIKNILKYPVQEGLDGV